MINPRKSQNGTRAASGSRASGCASVASTSTARHRKTRIRTAIENDFMQGDCSSFLSLIPGSTKVQELKAKG